MAAAAQTPIPTVMMEDILRRLFTEEFDEIRKSTESDLIERLRARRGLM